VGHVTRIGELRNTYKRSRKTRRKEPFGMLRCRWEDNTELNIKEIGFETDWIHLAQYRIQLHSVMSTVTNI
jgi:hypothetical protein